jgi:hypothetical protein
MVRFEDGQYCIESSFFDPYHIVTSATLEGMGNTQQYGYNTSPDHPKQWWDDGNRYCTYSPSFPMTFTTTIHFNDGSAQEVTNTVTGWKWVN